jgi:UDP:flavonoid glycosyltransferase YjiC (YdhE family)
MRIALAPDGTRGDVYPLLDVGSALLAHGHEAVVCASPDFADACRQRGLEFRPVGSEVRAFMDANAAGVTTGGLRALRAAGSWFRDTIEAQFRILPDVTRDADAILGAGVQIAGRSVAALHGIPYRYVVYCPVLFPSREHAPPLIPRATLPPRLAAAAWLAYRAVTNAFFRSAVNRERRMLGLPGIGDATAHLVSDRPLLACEPALAPTPRDCAFDVEQIGCLHRPDPTPLDPKLTAFLSQGPAPVYIGFGSMTDPQPDATTRLVLDAVSQLRCRALVSRGWAGLGDGALPEGVMAIDACSHAQLFPHCAAIVHHGGAGTTTAAARAGIPQIVVPHVADQFYWGERVRVLGLGPPPVRRAGITARALASALEQIAETDVMHERATEIAHRLAGPHPLDADPARFLSF